MIRTIVRRLSGLALWGTAFAPFLTGASHELSLTAGCVGLFAWMLLQFSWHRTLIILIALLYFSSIFALLWITRSNWILLPGLWGPWLIACAIAMFGLHRNTQSVGSPMAQDDLKSNRNNPQVHISDTQTKRDGVFYAIWGIGLGFMALSQQPYTPAIMAAWSCLMLYLARESIWIFYTNHEWLGYMMRRDCFVSQRQWRWRFARTFIALCLLIAAWYLVYQAFINA